MCDPNAALDAEKRGSTPTVRSWSASNSVVFHGRAVLLHDEFRLDGATPAKCRANPSEQQLRLPTSETRGYNLFHVKYFPVSSCRN